MSLNVANTSTLIVSGTAWLVILLVLALDLSGRWPRRRGLRWVWAGLLLLMSAQLVSVFAHNRNWPNDQLLVIDGLTLLIGLPALACIIIGVIGAVRSRRE
jgi:hypothetical protein